MNLRFESFVNSEEYQTKKVYLISLQLFESFVNSEEYQTVAVIESKSVAFESFVNSEEYQTSTLKSIIIYSLRALLIQKSIKQLTVQI